MGILWWAGWLPPRRESRTSESTARQDITVGGLAEALRATTHDSDKLDVLKNRLADLKGPFSGEHAVTILSCFTHPSSRLEALTVLAPKLDLPFGDKAYQETLRQVGSSYEGNSSELLRKTLEDRKNQHK